MRVNGILSFLSFCDVCSADCRSNGWLVIGLVVRCFFFGQPTFSFYQELVARKTFCSSRTTANFECCVAMDPLNSTVILCCEVCSISLSGSTQPYLVNHVTKTENAKKLSELTMFFTNF